MYVYIWFFLLLATEPPGKSDVSLFFFVHTTMQVEIPRPGIEPTSPAEEL